MFMYSVKVNKMFAAAIVVAIFIPYIILTNPLNDPSNKKYRMGTEKVNSRQFFLGALSAYL